MTDNQIEEDLSSQNGKVARRAIANANEMRKGRKKKKQYTYREVKIQPTDRSIETTNGRVIKMPSDE